MSVLSRAGVHGEVVGFSVARGRAVYEVAVNRVLGDEEFERLYRLAVENGFQPIQYVAGGAPYIRMIELRRRSRRRLVVLSLIASFVTVWLTGLALSQGYLYIMGGGGDSYILATVYAVLFLAVLGSHEYGHLRASWRYSVPVSGPFFIPAPPAQLGFIGSLGSVISMEGLPPSKRSLGLLGISGPLLGYVAGVIVGIVGVYLSGTIPVSVAEALQEQGVAEEVPFIPVTLLLLLMLRSPGPGYTVVLHPVAFVAFVIFMVTYLNLMPIGQLDGGHVVRSYVSASTHNLIGYAAIIGNLAIGVLFAAAGMGGSIYLAIGIVLVFFKLVLGRFPHPGSANTLSRLEGRYRALILLYIALLALTAPVPLV